LFALPSKSWVVLLCVGSLVLPVIGGSSRRDRSQEDKPGVIHSPERLPYSFVENRGQAHEDVRYLARDRAYALFLTPREAVFRLHGNRSRVEERQAESVLRLSLVGSRPDVEVTGESELAGRIHYLLGNDPAGWRTNVPTFGRVRYSDVYSGVDLLYYGADSRLEFDFVVAPGADTDVIRFRLNGPEAVRIDAEGRLVLDMGGHEVFLKAPIAYQEEPGGSRNRVEVASAFLLGEGNEVTFEVGDYDRTRELVIDPVLEYSSYLGGGDQDVADGIAVDKDRNAYVTGMTLSADFPTEGAMQGTVAGPQSDAFVTKISADGSTLIYSTYLGGEDSGDRGFDIAVDEDGYA